MKTKHKFLAVILTLCMVFGLTGVATFADDPDLVRVQFKLQMAVADGTNEPANYGIDYQLLDENNVAVSNEVINNASGRVDKSGSLDVDLNIPSSYHIKISVQNAGMVLKLGDANITDSEWTSTGIILSPDQIQSVYSFTLFNNSPSGDPDPNPNDPGNGGNNVQQGNTEAIVNYTYTGSKMDIIINDGWVNPTSEVPFEDGGYNTTAKFNTLEDDTTVTIHIGVIFIESLNKLEINGVDYSSYIPKTKEELVNAFSTQHTWTDVTVPRNISNGEEVYNITTESGEATEIGVGNFLWTYDESLKYRLRPDGSPETDNEGNPILNDDYINHGRLELVSFVYNGQTYSGDALAAIMDPGSAFDWELEEDPNSSMHGATLPAGSIVTVKLIPEYGYQLVNFSINGGAFEAGEEQSTFTFEIKPGNFHLGADFEQVEDSIATDSKVVKDGTIEIGADEIDTGSVILAVQDAEVTNTQKDSFSDATEKGYEVTNYFEIDLYQVIYKGTPEDFWYNALGKEENLETPAVITLEVGDIDGTEVSIIHEDHDGTYKVIPAEYDPVNKTIKFSTSGFSKYALAVRGSDIPTSTSSTKRFIIPMCVAAVAIVGVTVIFRKKEEMN